MNEYFLIILETMYSTIEHYVNMALYKCCILLLLLYKKHTFTFCPQMTGLSVSPGPDQLIIVHLEGGNDLVLCLETRDHEDRVGELVGNLCKIWHG